MLMAIKRIYSRPSRQTLQRKLKSPRLNSISLEQGQCLDGEVSPENVKFILH